MREKKENREEKKNLAFIYQEHLSNLSLKKN
jgi:hypothetical protein